MQEIIEDIINGRSEQYKNSFFIPLYKFINEIISIYILNIIYEVIIIVKVINFINNFNIDTLIYEKTFRYITDENIYKFFNKAERLVRMKE